MDLNHWRARITFFIWLNKPHTGGFLENGVTLLPHYHNKWCTHQLWIITDPLACAGWQTQLGAQGFKVTKKRACLSFVKANNATISHVMLFLNIYFNCHNTSPPKTCTKNGLTEKNTSSFCCQSWTTTRVKPQKQGRQSHITSSDTYSPLWSPAVRTNETMW